MTGRDQKTECFLHKRKCPLHDETFSSSNLNSCVGPQSRKRISFGDPCQSSRSAQTMTVLLPNSTQVVFSPHMMHAQIFSTLLYL